MAERKALHSGIGILPGPDAAAAGEEDAPRRYWSPLIAERRKRILDEARRLIGEVGAEGFTLRDLGRCAEVSVTTIYNIFGDKAGVITHAMRDFHAGIELSLPQCADEIDGFAQAIDYTTGVVVENRAYALALADLYFSRSLAPTLYEVIRGMPLQVFSHWLTLAEREGKLREGIDKESISTSFANLEWASIKDWGAARVTDQNLAEVRRRSLLLMVIAAARDPLRAVATQLLREAAPRR